MSIEEIEIKQVNQPVGFGKPTETPLQGVVFENGRIAYLNTVGDVCTAYDEKVLVKDLKQGNCIDVQIVRKG